MPSPKRLAPEILLQLHQDIRHEHGTLAEIAARYGVTLQSVCYHRKRLRDPYYTPAGTRRPRAVEGVRPVLRERTNLVEAVEASAERLEEEHVQRVAATRRVLAGDRGAVAEVVKRVPGLLRWQRGGETLYAREEAA
ncbi:MAG: hypothetical protein ACE147_00780 [Candidatus Methylomirabilales bacterium]